MVSVPTAAASSTGRMASPSVGEHVTDCASRIESVRRDVRLCVSLRVARLSSAHRGGGCRRRRCCMGCAESDRCCLLFAIHSPLTHCAHTLAIARPHASRAPSPHLEATCDRQRDQPRRPHRKKSRPHDASCSRAVATTVQRQHTHRNERNRGEGGMQAHVHTRPHMTQHSDHRHWERRRPTVRVEAVTHRDCSALEQATSTNTCHAMQMLFV